ncbi:MAG: TIGR01212 family radical SAM protein [Desulfobacca sp.]|nr:TIGR01212 family radical SAM protein [Desulfobacca sp.]
MSNQPYYTYSSYLSKRFGCRVQKISLDAGMTCPNRDGTKGTGGCVYCDARGSGSGASSGTPSIKEQMLQGQGFLKQRYGAKKFIAYFQSFSNTYGPFDRLKSLYLEALSIEEVVGISVGTRPDCISPEILDLLAGFQKTHLVWIEYGLQSFHGQTLELINRGHTIEEFVRAIEETRKRDINICVHVILGLPGEGLKECLSTADRLAEMDIQGLKLHSLYINRGTLLETWYQQGKVQLLNQEQYVDWACQFLERCPPHWIIQRLTGDPAPGQLVAPQWALKKQETLQMIKAQFAKTGGYQGAKWKLGMTRSG